MGPLQALRFVAEFKLSEVAFDVEGLETDGFWAFWALGVGYRSLKSSLYDSYIEVYSSSMQAYYSYARGI